MSKPSKPLPASAKSERGRRHQVVRVGRLPLAAAVALGAPMPWALAQTAATVITPLTGSSATQTVLGQSQSGTKVITTATLRDGNAFNNFSLFQIGTGDTVKMVVPTGANWLVNVVRDGRVQIDGLLQGRLGAENGVLGGNLLFIDSHGFAVGPNGRVDTGRLTFAAPSTTFVDAMLASGPGMSASQVTGILTGQFERSDTGNVQIDGEIHAQDGVQIMAGKGTGSVRAVTVNGSIVIDGRKAGSAVNLGNLRSLTPVLEADGVIDITTPGDLLINGKLLADASHWTQAGAVRVVAGGDIALGAQSLVSASALAGSEGQGGQATLFAYGSVSNALGATLAARGDGFGAGGFIELSAAKSVQIGGLTMDAGSDTGKAGLAYIDPADLLITGSIYTNGANLSLDATQTLRVNTGVTLNTRRVTADAASASGVSGAATAITNNPLTRSLGNSGNITLTAPSITVQSGATLDASVINQSGTTYAAGDITLTATQANSGTTFISLADANASIDVAGTLTGRNVTLSASIESAASFGGSSATIQQEAIALMLGDVPFTASLSYVEAKGNATVTLQPTAVLKATENITLSAMADRSVSIETEAAGSSKANLSAGFARVLGNTKVDVKGGASLQADGDIALVAASKTTVTMASSAAGETDPDTGAYNVASIVFAGSMSDVSTSVNVASGATLQSGGDTLLQAFHSGHYDTTAAVTVYGGGTAGVVGALSLQNSTTSVTMDGQITAGGQVSVMAMNASAKNAISATSANATAEEEQSALAGLPTSLQYSKDDAGAAAEKQLLDSFKALSEEASASSDTASGGAPAETKPPALRLAGAMTWSESNHTTRATVGAGARITAGGNAVVDAQTLVGQLQSVATSEATSETNDKQGTKTSLAVAFNYASHNMTTRALVGAGAEITANHVAVNASTDIPEFYTNGLPLDWSSFSSAYANLMGGTEFLLAGFNSRVGASSSATNLAAAGAVNLTFMKNDTRAWVDTGAKLTTRITDGAAWSYDVKEVGFDSDLVEMLIPINTYTLDKDLGVLGNFVSATRTAPAGPALDEINFTRTMNGSTVVRAQNHVQTLHHAGGPAPAAGASGTSVGGTFSMVSRDNTAIAGIADLAEINTQRLDVTAETSDWLISISPTSGKGAGVAANGIASYNKLTETTRASISREALVTAPTVNVDAQLSLGVIALTGAVSRSENSGVGIGLAINDITGDTRAYVGDNDTDSGRADTAEGNMGAIVTSALRVQARSDGKIVAVGVAGASAGEKPAPEEPAPPASTGENLAGKTATDSANAQTQLNGSDATMAPVAESSAPIKGNGSDQATASEPAASKPPSFSIAGAGAIVTNYSDLDTTALIDRAVVRAAGSGTSTVAVRALSDLTQVSVAGGGALALSQNASTKFSSAIAGAVALQDSDDDTTARIVGSTLSDLADESGSLVVQALKSGERTAVATGISANLSKGSTTSVSVVGSASVTTTSDDTVAVMENSTVTGHVASPTALGVQVAAYDRSRIGAGGGALSVSTGKGSAGVGAAISIVNAKGSTQAQVSGGSITQAHDLAVLALSSQKVVGVGAVAGVQTSSDSTSAGQLMGSFVFNHIGTTLSAGVKNGAVVNLTGDLAVQGGGTATTTTTSFDTLLGAARASEVMDYEMTSAGHGYTSELKNAVGGESIVGVAGTLGMALGSNSASLGLSYVHNDIQTSYDAELNGTINATGGISVQALSRADIVGVSVGLGATKGKFSGMGSASVNLIGQRTRAMVTGGSVNASGLLVNSQTQGRQFGLAGNVSMAVGGGSGNAAGAAVAYTLSAGRNYAVNGDTSSTRAAGNEASINNAQINVGTGQVLVSAQHTSDTQSVAASGVAADGNVGFAGTMSFTDVGGVTQAVVNNADLTAGTVSVTAGEAADGRTARSLSVAGGLALSKGYAGALAVAWNTMSGVRSARITDSDLVVRNAVTVESSAKSSIQTLAVAVSAGKDGAGSGSIATNFMISDTSAEFSGGSLSGTATNLTVRATGSSAIDSLSGAVSAGGTGAIGGALSVNSVGEGSDNFRVRTRLANTSLSAPVAVTVESNLSGTIQSIAASGSGAGTAAINGSVTVNAIEADVLTEVSGVNQTGNGGAFQVHANNDADISSLAGTISGAGNAAVGAAVSVNKIGGNVSARVADSTLRATNAVEVDATTSGTIRSVAAGVSGGGTVGLAGSNTTNAITSQVLAQMSNVTQSATSTSLRVKALDSSTIQSFAGSVAGGGTAAGGAAFALNFLGRTATNADSSKLVKAEVVNSNLNSGGAVQVQALSTSVIESMGLAVGGSGNAAVTGSNTTNLLEDEITATWSGGSLYGSATSLTVQADDAATVRTLAGNVSGAVTGAFGAAIAVNQVGSTVQANLSGMTLHAAAAVAVDADLRGEIKSVAASGAADAFASVNGSFTTNTLNASVKAQAVSVTQVTNGGAFSVSADNDSDIFALAGTISGSGGAAVGAAVAVNDIGGDVTALLTSSTVRAPGQVNVQATSSGSIESIAAGVSGGGSAALAGSNTTNALTSTVQAKMDGVNLVVDTTALNVLARDTSSIKSFAGTVAGGGSAAGGAAVALNYLGRTIANADSSKVVKAEVSNSIVRATGAAQVNAYSTSVIQSIGVAAGASGTSAITGSNATNLLEDEITSSWTGSSLVSSNALTVSARQAAEISSLAGNVSGSMGASVGAAVAVNRIGTATNATLVGETNARFNSGLGNWTMTADDVVLSAESDNQINTIAVGMSAGAAGVQGSVAVSVIESQTNATLGADLHVTNVIANDSVAVTANSRDRIRALAGAVGLGATGVGAAGGVLTNIIANTTSAGINGVDSHVNAFANGSGLAVRTASLASAPNLMNINKLSDSVLSGASFGTRTVKGLAVQATSIQQIGALTAVAGGGATGAAGAAINVDKIGGTTRAYIDSAVFINDTVTGNTAQSTDVMAANHAMIASSASALAIGAAGVSGAVGTEVVERSTRAEVIDGARIFAKDAASVNAVSTNSVAQISAGAAGGALAGLAGSGDVVLLKGSTVALVDRATVSADSISVVADGTNSANLIAGSIAGGGAVGAGLSFTVNVSGSTVLAKVNDTTLKADGAVVIDAENRTESFAVSAAAAVGGGTGVAVGAAVTVMQGATEAGLTGTSTLSRRTLATGLVASSNNAAVSIALASDYDDVTTGNQNNVRFSLSDLTGRVNPASAVVTVTDGTTSVTAVRQADGTYSANVAGLADGALMAQVVLTEGGVSKVSTTTLVKSTGINSSEIAPVASSLPAASTRIATLSSFDQLDARNHGAVRFVLKGSNGIQPTSDAVVTVGDGTRSVIATLNADGSYTADVRSLGDGMLTALVTMATGETSRVTLAKSSGAGSLSVTANEHVTLNNNAGQIGVGGVAGIGTSANVVVGKSTVVAKVDAQNIRVAGALTVAAERDAIIDMITATAGGGGFAGVSGAVGVLVFGSAPDSNSNSELTGNQSTLGQIGSVTQANRSQGTGSALSADETTSLNNSGRYDTQGAYAGASGSHSTSATVAAQSIVAGSVSVMGLDRTSVDNNAGAVALGGAAGVSAGVAITLLGGANHAGVSVGSLTVAGDMNIESGTRTPQEGNPAVESRAIAGAGGFVGVGAAVSVASNTSANTAVLAGMSSAGGAVHVTALDQASMRSEAVGAAAGFVSVGAVTATAKQSGTVATTISGQHSGTGWHAFAERDASAAAQATGGSAGVYAGSGAGAAVSDSGSVTMTLASGTALDAGTGDLELSAKATPSADAQAIGVSVARGAAVGVSVATSDVDTSVRVLANGPLSLSGKNMLVAAVLGSGNSSVHAKAIAGGGGLLLGAQGAAATASNKGTASVTFAGGATLAATGDVGISANDSMSMSTESTGIGVGFVGAGVAVALTESNSTVSTYARALGGRVQGNLTVSGRGDEIIDADAVAGTGGVLAGAGADARISHVQNVTATLSTASAGLLVDGITAVTADRKVRYDNQSSTLNASAFGGSGSVTEATLTGSATALLENNAKLGSAQLQVLATNDVERKDLTAVSAQGGGGGVLAGAGADAKTTINGNAVAEIGDDVSLTLGTDGNGLFEVRAYNQLRGSSLGRLDLGGAIPIALVNTEIRSNANATAKIGARNNIYVAGETFVDALSYVDIEANTITKTFGAAAAAQGDALAQANVNNQVSVGTDSVLTGEGNVTLLAGQDKGFWRNKSFVTARSDLFNHSAVPVSINPNVDATLNLTNNLTLGGQSVRSGGTIQLGGITGTYVVEGKGKVSDWTRDVGQLMGISSEYGSSTKNLNANVVLSGLIEAGYGNKQRLVINPNGQIAENTGNIRFSIGTEDLASTGAAYLETLYNQLKNYGDIPAVRAFVEAELAFYLQTLLREGFATTETDPVTGATMVVPQENVPGTFLTLKNIRAGSGNVELFGNNVTGTASVIAKADSEILIDNKSPMNIRVKDLVIDSSGGFAKYNGAYLKSSADIANFNRDVKTGLNITVDSIDTRGGGAGEALPTIKILNSYVSSGVVSSTPVIATAPDGSSADLRQDQMRSPEIRVNGLVYNKLGPIVLENTSGSISVTAEDPLYTPRLDGLEVQINSGKNFVLSSPTVSQSVGGSPENLYAVAYTTDQQTKLNNMGVVGCGSARAGVPAATSFDANCVRNGAGGIYASGGIFLGARYLNINGTVQSGQSDYAVTLTDASVGAKIRAWDSEWSFNRGRYQSQGRSSWMQISGRLSSDSEADVNKRFANGTITLAQRDTELAAMAARRKEPIIYFDAESDTLKVAETNVTGGLVEMVGSIINTGGGVVRALDGYARFNIDNQTNYGIDLMGLNTGGDAGVIRITDLNRPVYTNGQVTAYEVTTYERNAAGAFKSTTTAGRGATAPVLRSSNSTLAAPDASRPDLLATFSYAPVTNSNYVWSAGYEYSQEKRYWYQKSSMLWGAINLGSINWNSVETINKTASAMPEGIYVTTSNAPSANFWMGTQTITTAAEREIYRRQWKKCGFLCFKKTYYVDYRTEVGSKDVFTQSVRADHPIAIELVGYNSGLIRVNSKGSISLAGNLTNDSGLVSLTSSLGSIKQFSSGASVKGDDLRFYASTGIGTEGSPINVITGSGSFTATSTSGNVAFQSLGGALRINQVSTTGKVWLLGDEDIVGVDPSKVHVTGSRIEISAPRGGIGEFNADGSVKSTLNIQTENSAGGGITATAARGIALKQATGNLWVNQVASSGGDVYIEAGGDLIDNNRNETRDVRTEEELLSLWKAAALQGSDAETSRLQTLRNTRSQFRRYWALRNVVVTSVNPATGAVVNYTADNYNPATYQFTFSATEKQQLAQSGLTAAQITAMEAARTQELKDLHALYGTTAYQTSDDLIIAQVNAANLAAGRPAVDAMSTWSTAELKSPLPKAIFSKSTTDTQTRIEEPNVVGNRVVLRPGGKIGRDDGSVIINLLKAGGLTTEDQLTIMSAESDDMTLNKSNWLLTVVKKDTFDVLSNKLNIISNGFVYLGSEPTDAYPNGGNANLEKVTGNGEIRIKVSGSILNASNTSESVIQGHKAILEAASGSIGTALKPVTMTLTGGGNLSNATLVARAQDGIWIDQTGDIRIADVYSPGFVALTAQGAIIDARGADRTRSLEAGEATLTAKNGSVGTALNPIVAKMSVSGGVNASTPVGYSVYLQGAETGLTVKNINSGLDVDLYSPTGPLRARGSVTAIGRLTAEADGTGDIAMESGSLFQAVSGDIYVGAEDVGLGRLDAARAVVVNARGAITDNNTDATHVNAAGRSVTLTALGSIGTSAQAVDVLTKENTRLVATSRDGDAYLSSNAGILHISQVSANGLAALSSAYSILDERGTNAQAVSAANVSFAAGGDIGQASLPMTIRTAANGLVTQANAAGSVYLSAPWGVLTVKDAQATTGQISLNGSAYGLTMTGTMTSAQGMTLTGGLNDVNFSSQANLDNLNGSLVIKGTNIKMADGAKIDGSTGTMVLSATGDITLTGLSSANTTRSAILVSTTAGAVRDAGDSNAYDMKVTSATGGIQVTAQGDVGDSTLAANAAGRFLETDAPVLQVASKVGSVSLAQIGATTDVVLTAGKNVELLSQAAIVGSKISALGGNLVVRSTGGGVKLTSATATQNFEVSAAGLIDLGAITVPGDILINSTVAGGVTALALTAGLNLSVSAAGATGDLRLTTLAAKAGNLTLNAAGTLSASSATATGNITLSAAGNASTGAATSSAGTVDLKSTGGTLTTGAVSGASSVLLKSSGNLVTGALTSTTANVNAQSLTGSVAVTTAKAATALVAQSGTDMTLGTYTVSGGTATLTSGAAFTSTSGTASGNITLSAAGNASTGAATSSAGTVDLKSTGGMLTTGAVSGTSGVLLKSSGNLVATTVTSTSANVNAQSLTGSVAVTTAKAATALVAQSGTDMTLGTYAVSGGTATLTSAGTFTSTSGTASGNITLSAAGNASTGAATSSAGTVDLKSTGGTLTTGAVSGTSGVLLKSSGNLVTGALTSTSANVNVQSVAGSVAVTTAKAATALVAQSGTDMALGTYAVSGGTATLTSGAAFTSTSGTASGNITLSAVGNASTGAATSSAGTVDLKSTGGTLTTGAVSGTSGVLLKSSGNLVTGALTSTSANVNVQSVAGSVAVTTAKAATALVAQSGTDMALGTYAVSGGTATLTSGAAFTSTSGTASGNITLSAVGNASTGAATSSAGTVDLKSTGGTLTTGAVSGASSVLLKSSGNLVATTVTSTNANVNAQSLTGSVAVTTAKAATALVAQSGTTMTLGSFTVSAGGANLTSGTDFTSGTGTSYGPMTISMTGIGSLGTLTTTTGAINATSTLKGMSFTALKAGTGIILRAKANMGLGLNPTFALFGTSLDAGTGAVDAQTTTGNIQIGKLIAKTNSTVKTSDGSLKISAVTLPALVTITATTSGTRSLPAGY
ncbi:MAG: leukotoxin LktA family filamentous adhesin [Limnohabitans sp.]